MSNAVSDTDIKHLAKLANLNIDEHLVPKLTTQLGEILDFVGQLKEVDTSSIDETSEVTGLKNITQTDDQIACLTQEAVLASAARTLDGYVVVKGVFENQDA